MLSPWCYSGKIQWCDLQWPWRCTETWCTGRNLINKTIHHSGETRVSVCIIVQYIDFFKYNIIIYYKIVYIYIYIYVYTCTYTYIYIIQNSRWWNLGKKRNKFGIESGILCYCKLSRLQHADGVIFGCLSWWIDGMSSLLSSTLVRSSSSSFLGSINLQIEPWYLVYYSILYPQITQYYSSIVLQLNSTGLLDLLLDLYTFQPKNVVTMMLSKV
jgi:hypothetical protein